MHDLRFASYVMFSIADLFGDLRPTLGFPLLSSLNFCFLELISPLPYLPGLVISARVDPSRLSRFWDRPVEK